MMANTKYVRICSHDIENDEFNKYTEAALTGFIEMGKDGIAKKYDGLLREEVNLEMFVEILTNHLIGILSEDVIIKRFAAGRIEFERKADVTVFFHHHELDWELTTPCCD